ncbi:hypothetical protein B4158_2733 [Bacillus cereus]|nr:hypothetical protein B4158_2733 [Bacillus cereus]
MPIRKTINIASVKRIFLLISATLMKFEIVRNIMSPPIFLSVKN